MNPLPVPPVIVTTGRSPRRRRPIVGEIFALFSSFVIVGSIGYGVYRGVTSNDRYWTSRDHRGPGFVSVPEESSRPITPAGGGRRSEIRPVIHEPGVSLRQKVVGLPPGESPAASLVQADALVHESLTAARKGMFDEASRLAEKARTVAPEHPAATGAWYLAAYAEKYPQLADEALDRLHGDDVDLGFTHGRAAFVERSGDMFTFRGSGQRLVLSLAELKNLDGVRFGITRRFLDYADLSANHLILAAIHHLKKLDATGRLNVKEPEKCLEAAVERCRRAAKRQDETAEHAKHMRGLFAWLESQSAAKDMAADNEP